MIPNRLTHSRTKYKAMTNFAGAPQYSVGNSNTGVKVFFCRLCKRLESVAWEVCVVYVTSGKPRGRH